MIAIRPFQDAFRNVGRNALDLPVAALSGLAVVFVAFAMPGGLLADAVGASGLPSVLPAAAPPLGLTARAAIGVGGAIATFFLVFALLRLLDRSGLDAPRGKREAEPADENPRLRRRDVHPDAPVRRPISAARDLGEPQRRGGRRDAPTALWLPEAEPKEAVSFETPVPEAAPVEAQPETVFEPRAEFEPVAEAVREPEIFTGPEVEPAPAPSADFPSSLPELMERLERGLARRQTPPASAPGPAATPAAPQVFPEARDDRLQSAIDSLQRLAARTPS